MCMCVICLQANTAASVDTSRLCSNQIQFCHCLPRTTNLQLEVLDSKLASLPSGGSANAGLFHPCVWLSHAVAIIWLNWLKTQETQCNVHIYQLILSNISKGWIEDAWRAVWGNGCGASCSSQLVVPLSRGCMIQELTTFWESSKVTFPHLHPYKTWPKAQPCLGPSFPDGTSHPEAIEGCQLSVKRLVNSDKDFNSWMPGKWELRPNYISESLS